MPPRLTYQLRIDLMRTKPPIWRRVLVPASMYLDILHEVVQVAMGWEDSHMHMFSTGTRRYSTPTPWAHEFRRPGTPRDLDERKYRIGQLVTREKDWITYMYDFGDSWEHRITLQKILPYDRAVRLSACTAGRRRCPPEDCGGVWGYYQLLDALKDLNAPDHAHMKEWYGEDFDPVSFSPRDVDRVLAQMRW